MSITRNLLIAALLASGGNAVAASSVDLVVKGAITPSACTPILANGGVAEFGKTPVKDLNADRHTALPEQTLEMTVTCEAATLFALAAKDNREGTESSLDYYNFGLGLINGGEKLGYFSVYMFNRQGDGAAVRAIGSRDGGVTWENEMSVTDDGLSAFAAAGTLIPLPIQRLTTDLQVVAYIAPANSLTLTEEVPINGSLTFTVKYL